MDRHPLTLSALLFGSAVSAQPTPIFHWALDEGSGPLAYEWNNGPQGVLQGGTQWDPTGGHHAGACRFDGVDDRILLGPCDLTTGSGIAISVWVKPDLVTGMERTVIAKTVGPAAADHIWSIAFVQGSAIRFRLRTGASTVTASTSPSSIFSGAWYHIVATYDGAWMRTYVNGSLMVETAATGGMGYHPQAPASLGALSTGAAPFSGWIDDVRIYDRGLSPAEVIDILLEPGLTTGIGSTALASGAFPPGNWTAMELLDASGRVLRARPLRAGGTVVLNEAPGFYYLRLTGEGTHRTWPLVVP